MQTSVFLSIRPRFAEAILSGVKRFEFRGVLFRNRNAQRVVIYASSPVRKVVGEFLIEDVLSMDPETLWHATNREPGIDKAYFDDYFRGCTTGHAVKIRQPQRYNKPLELEEHFGIDRPPKSFCYLT